MTATTRLTGIPMPRAAQVTTLLALVLLAGAIAAACASRATPADAPLFDVDPLWPRPLPDHWLLGSAVGVAVDARDYVFVLHDTDSFNRRTEIGAAANPPTGDCCLPAPAVLVFDPDGNLVDHWGGPGDGYTWPEANQGLAIDPAGNVWIGGSADGDTHVLRFSADGRFLAQFGAPGQTHDSGSTQSFGGVARFSFDEAAGEAYLADGVHHRRVAVIDMNTGALKRAWGAHGDPPQNVDPGAYDPTAAPARQFRGVHCAALSAEGLVYVCDRQSNRIQVFRSDGTFEREAFIEPQTLGEGAVWDIAFSRDPEQRFVYVADGMNMRVHVLDRQSLEVLTSFGAGGRQPGQFFAVHSVATDSQGNLYTTESAEGKRVQKFIYRGIAPVTARQQGVLWPGR